MPFALHLHLVMMSKYSKFGVDLLLEKWATLKFLHDNNDNDDNDLAITITLDFLRNRRAKKLLISHKF